MATVPDHPDQYPRPGENPEQVPDPDAGDFAAVEAFLAAHPDELSLDAFGGFTDPEEEQIPGFGIRWMTDDGREPMPDRDQIEGIGGSTAEEAEP